MKTGLWFVTLISVLLPITSFSWWGNGYHYGWGHSGYYRVYHHPYYKHYHHRRCPVKTICNHHGCWKQRIC